MFHELLDQLRVEEFQIDVGHYVVVQRLLNRLGSTLGPGDLCTHIAPLVVRSREEQDRFYATFNRVYPLFANPLPDNPTNVTHEVRTESKSRPVDIHSRPGSRRRVRWLVTGITVAIGVVVLMIVAATKPRGDDTQIAQPTFVESGPTAGVAHPIADDGVSLGPWVIFGIPFLMVLLTEWWQHRRRQLVVERTRTQKPPFVWPLRVQGPALAWFGSTAFRRAASMLRHRETSTALRFSPEDSVAATIEAGGRAAPRFRPGSQPPEYLVLMERAAWRDHLAAFFGHIVEAMENEGVHVTPFYFDRDPRICVDADTNESHRLVDLRARYPLHRLLILGTGDGLVDPVTGRLHSWVEILFDWPRRALLTPTASRSWGVSEFRLGGHFLVLPCSVAGLEALVEVFENSNPPPIIAWQRKDSSPQPPHGDQRVRSIRVYLGEPCFRWLAACALYPELHWDITLMLGAMPVVGEGLLTEQNLLRMIRLDFFRLGTMPDDIRLELSQSLDPETEQAVRREIVRIIEKTSPPVGTVAAERFGLQLAVQRLFSSRQDRSARRRELRIIKGLPHAEITRDVALVRLLEGLPRSRLTLLLPRELRGRFYRHGIPSFGMRSATRLGFAAVATGALILAARTLNGYWSFTQSGPFQFENSVAIPTRHGQGHLAITQLPDDGSVVINSSTATARRYDLDPGTYIVQLAAEGFASTFDTVTIESGDTTTLAYTGTVIRPQVAQPVPSRAPATSTSQPALGVLRILVTGRTARISVNGVLKRESNRHQEVLPPGIHLVTLEATGLTTVDTAITVQAGDTTNVTLRMLPVISQNTVERLAIERAITSYGAAIESQEVGELRRAFPGLGSDNELRFQQFFETVTELKVTLTIVELAVDGEVARASVDGKYEFQLDGASQLTDFRMEMTLRRGVLGWEVSSVR